MSHAEQTYGYAVKRAKSHARDASDDAGDMRQPDEAQAFYDELIARLTKQREAL